MCGCRTFSLVPGLPSRLSSVGCPPLFEPFIGTTPKSDSWPAPLWVVRLSPFPTGLPLTSAADADQVSRFSCMMFPDVRGVSDCAGSPGGFVLAPPRVWSSPYAIGSTPWICSFTAQYPACPCPYLRFASSLSTDGARLGVRMGHYSFPVRLFHSLHHAGLSRRTAYPTKKADWKARLQAGLPATRRRLTQARDAAESFRQLDCAHDGFRHRFGSRYA